MPILVIVMMRKYIREKKAVSPVIAVILMVAITVVLAGVLYVWVTSLADTSAKKVIVLGVTTTDAPELASKLATDPVKGPTGFEKGEAILTVHHSTGGPINWTAITKIQIQKLGYDILYPLEVLTINNLPYGPGNYMTEISESLTLGIKNASYNDIVVSGDLVIVKMSGDGYVWNSPSAGIRVQ